MDSLQNMIFQNNNPKYIRLKNFNKQNLVMAPIKKITNRIHTLNEKNIIQNSNSITNFRPKNVIGTKKIHKIIKIKDQRISPIPSKKLRNTIRYVNRYEYTDFKQEPNRSLFPKLISLTTRNSKEKEPRDSVSKSRHNTKYAPKIKTTFKKEIKNSLSENSLYNSSTKEKSPNIFSIKGVNLFKKNPSYKIKKLNKFPEDSISYRIYDNPEKLNLKEFVYEKQIGKGTFGNIDSVKWKKNNKIYSLKKEILTNEYVVQNRKKAYKIIQNFIGKCGSKGIIHIYCNLFYKIKVKNNNKNNKGQNPNNNNEKIIYEYYELMEKADMDWEKEICERRKNSNFYTENELLNILFQLVTVLSSLQQNHITHRDIKPQNILIIKGKYKLCDFGEMRELEKDGLIVQRVRGSELYMSTILFKALHNNLALVKHNTYKSDVFSLGMCLFYAASLTYGGVDSIRELDDMNEIKNILFNYLGKRYSEKLISLILMMLEVDESIRPNFIQLEKIVKLSFVNIEI